MYSTVPATASLSDIECQAHNGFLLHRNIVFVTGSLYKEHFLIQALRSKSIQTAANNIMYFFHKYFLQHLCQIKEQLKKNNISLALTT